MSAIPSMIIMIMALNAMQSLNAFNTVVFQDVISVFNFLPDQQFSHLRSQIYDILQNRQAAINPKSVYLEAASIVSEIQNAYANVVSLPHNQLLKRDSANNLQVETAFSGRSESGEEKPFTKNKYASDKPRANRQLYNDDHINVLGLFDIFNHEEKAKVESALNMISANHDFDSHVSLIKNIINEAAQVDPNKALEYTKKLDEISNSGSLDWAKLKTVKKKAINALHPDKAPPERQQLANDIFKKYSHIMKETNPGHGFSYDLKSYNHIVDLIKIYEKDQNSWFKKSNFKKWEKLQQDMKNIGYDGFFQQDRLIFNQILDGKKLSYNQKINYFGRKSSFLEIVEKEFLMIDQLILENTKRPEIYRNKNWIRLQAALEDRQEYLVKILKSGQPNIQAAERQFHRRQGLTTVIGGALFLAVLAFLKGAMHTENIESNLNESNHRNL